MRILLTGATGLIGTELGIRLAKEGHELVVLTRKPDQALERLPFPCEAYSWNAEVELPPARALANLDAVIHLAGEPIAARRWNEDQKKRILESRVLGTRHLMEALQALPVAGKPLTVISASAIGFYGNRGDEVLDESSSTGADFLAAICRQWEAEALKFVRVDTRVAIVRIGIVLSAEGGALDKLIPVFQTGLGGPVGSGKQWMSWIHVDDLVSVFMETLKNPKLAGVINGVAPSPVTNQTFSRALGKALRKPARLRTPATAVRAAMGEMGTLALMSQKVLPKALLSAGFHFRWSQLEPALEAVTALLPQAGTQRFRARQWVPFAIDRVFTFFSEAGNLEALTPPWLGFHVLGKSTAELGSGTLIDYRLKIHGVPVRWQSRIENWKPNESFMDTQIRGPYYKWEHTHRFMPMKGGTMIEDDVTYQVPGGILGSVIAGSFVRKDIAKIFEYRKLKIRERFPAQGAGSALQGTFHEPA